MAAKAPTAIPASMPKGEWPGAWKLYQFSKVAVLRNWQVILGLLLTSMFFSLLFSMVFDGEEASFFSDLLANLVGIAISLILTVVYFTSVRGKTISFTGAVAKFDPIIYFKFLGATIVSGVLSFLALLAFIVPFFFVFPRLIMAPYLVIDKGLDPIEATIQSWKMTDGHIGKVWGIVGATLAMALLMLTIIGIPFALYFIFMYQLAMVILYEYIASQKPSKNK